MRVTGAMILVTWPARQAQVEHPQFLAKRLQHGALLDKHGAASLAVPAMICGVRVRMIRLSGLEIGAGRLPVDARGLRNT